MADLKYGDIVCYTNTDGSHETNPIMFIGACSHTPFRDWKNWDCIDIWDITNGRPYTDILDHKAADCWQKCTHLDE